MSRTTGERHIMVAIELMMSLYTPLYAFPKLPTSLFAESEKDWVDVATVAEMRAVLTVQLQGSATLRTALATGQTPRDITLEALANPQRLSALFNLRLYDEYDPVPITCRQMFESIAAVYAALRLVNLKSRDLLREVYARYQMFPAEYKLPLDTEVTPVTVSSLRMFCKVLTFHWIQAYVADQEGFYFPKGGRLLG